MLSTNVTFIIIIIIIITVCATNLVNIEQRPYTQRVVLHVVHQTLQVAVDMTRDT